MSSAPQVILGIDPGTLVMGYGLISVRNGTISMLEMGILKLSAKEDHSERLHLIFKKMESLMKIHKPTHVAIEAPFFGKNVQSMLKLGRAQGVAIAAAMAGGLMATEYAPRKIKQSITGNGNATKEQVWKMLQCTLKFEEESPYMDATDALAVALCHHYQLSNPLAAITIQKKAGKKKVTSWETFLSVNPDRIK
ncbi:MAG: crossover junction endodeoxyribonuclease RuvC [Taibaiella sp.]|nr:crossover junction endodeoxyribonuclease RuvC [Taibaiella sp.]